MFQKYANATVLGVERGPVPAAFAKAAHRAVFDYVPKEGFIYVRSRAISSRCNDNFDYFGPEEIEKSYHTFVGKPVFINHHNDDHKRMRGAVIAAALHKDRNPDGSPDTWCEVLMEVDGLRFPKLAEKLIKGEIDRTSMGCDVQFSKCSACGRVASSPAEYCQHIPQMKGRRIWKVDPKTGKKTSKLIFEECIGLSFFENSLLVEPPADPTAYFLDRPVLGPGLEHLSSLAHTAAMQTLPTSSPPPAQRPSVRTASRQEPVVPRSTDHIWALINQEFALQQREAASNKPTANQASAEAFLAEHPVSVHHILSRVEVAASNPHTLHSGMKWYYDAHGMAKTMASHHYGDDEDGLKKVAGALGVYSASSAPAPNFHMASLALHAGRGIYSKTDKETGEFIGDKGVPDHEYDYNGKPMASEADGKKVTRILNGEHYEDVIGSSKTKTYARLIHNPDNDHDVVIDRHAVAAAVGHYGNSGEVYDKVAGPIDNAAKAHGGSIYNRVADAYRQATHALNNNPEYSPLRRHLVRSGLLGEGEQIKPHQVQALAWIVQKDISDQHARSDMSDSNQKSIDNWQNHYTSRYGGDAHHPVSGKGFYGADPTNLAPGQQRAAMLRAVVAARHRYRQAMQRIAYGETKAPHDVDTLRDEQCAICGNTSAYDGRQCQVCGYTAPPKALDDPDTDKAKALDQLKQSIDDQRAEADPSAPGADVDAENLGAAQGTGDDPGSPWLECPTCATSLRPAAPQTSQGNGAPPAGPTEGAECPVCGGGPLVSSGVTEDSQVDQDTDNDGVPDSQEDADGDGVPDDQETKQQADENDEAAAEEDDDDEDDPKKSKKLPASKAARARKQWNPHEGAHVMRPAMAALFEQQKLIDEQQKIINRLTATAAKQHSQIQRLTAGLTVLASNGGEELVGRVKVAMIQKHADEQNPAQPVPEPAAEAPVVTTAEAETPEVMTNVMMPGLVPGSTNDVAANAVSTAYTPGMDIPAPVVHNLVDPTRPVDGTQGPRPVSETITHPEVRVGNPMNPQTAFPLTGPFTNAQRTGSVQGEPDAATTMAALRLARLKIAAGVEQGEDIVLAQKIASTSHMDEIRHDIATYTELAQAANQRRTAAVGPQGGPRNAVPRSVAQRTVPALGGAPQIRTTASADGVDPDIESIFINL